MSKILIVDYIKEENRLNVFSFIAKELEKKFENWTVFACDPDFLIGFSGKKQVRKNVSELKNILSVYELDLRAISFSLPFSVAVQLSGLSEEELKEVGINLRWEEYSRFENI